MNLGTIFRFQLGFKDAIETVALNRASLWTGMVLVLITGIARNYDQLYCLETPLWLFGPVLFSFFSGSFLFLILYKGFIRRHLEDPDSVSTGTQWRCFMSLFWMTAPIAWLYAIPVERFLNSYHAAQANLTLLAIVSLWRVLLMARVVSVLQKMKFLRAIGWVMVPACMEILVVGFLGGFANLNRRIMAGMGGMRNSPEENLIIATLGNVLLGAFVLLIVLSLLLAWRRFGDDVSPFPTQMTGRIRTGPLLLLAIVWIAIALPAQVEQQRFVTHAGLIARGRYLESVDYLARHTRKDFPASRRLEPNPYEYRVFKQLPPTMAALRADHPGWVRRVYLEHLGSYFDHYFYHTEPAQFKELFLALERMPERQEWLTTNREKLTKLKMVLVQKYDAGSTNALAAHDLIESLQRLGVDLSSITNKGTR